MSQSGATHDAGRALVLIVEDEEPIALALSFIVMFAAEMINARSGLGHLIRDAESSLRFDLMYVALVSIAILGYAGDRLLRFARSRALAWQDT